MKTTEIRRLALKIAIGVYENAGGDLGLTLWDLSEEAPKYGISDDETIVGVENYLSSVKIMEHIALGERSLRFTDYGIRVLEDTIDEPDRAHAPFPPLNVVIREITNSQVAIGSGSTFNQASNNQQGLDPAQLSDLVRIALTTWDERNRALAAGAAAAIETEARSPQPDTELIRGAATKLASIATKVGETVATQSLIAYFKVHGIGT